jgi:PTS system galactitol-specific IIB component
MKPSGVECTFLSGICFLTGMGIEKTTKEMLELMK